VTVLAIRAGRSHGYFLAGWLWYVGTLVPVIGLVQVGDQSMADRYTYIPLIGLFVAIAWGAVELAARWQYGRIALPAAALLALLGCAAVARAQVGYWSDSTALWRRALEVTEGNYVAHKNLGGVLVKQGKTGEAIRVN
jgi:protein O-mannosyl-transferase